MFLWIDPPGDDAGWIYSNIETDGDFAQVVAKHSIPADNQARKFAYDMAEERGENPGAREHWGVTGLDALPVPLPEGIIMVNPTNPKE